MADLSKPAFCSHCMVPLVLRLATSVSCLPSGNRKWVGCGYEPLAVVEAKWETSPPPNREGSWCCFHVLREAKRKPAMPEL